ncbi:MAG: response regulator [Planctomycetes bacterium]|nr:response regulator [Planctomycetota bacterium]
MQLNQPHVLITDDDRDFRLTLADALSQRGFATHLAADGLEALNVIRHGEIHLAVMDVHMPRLDGLEALENVRSSHPHMPCILMTANLDDSIVQRAKALHTDEVLSKPFPFNVLATAIRRLIEINYRKD